MVLVVRLWHRDRWFTYYSGLHTFMLTRSLVFDANISHETKLIVCQMGNCLNQRRFPRADSKRRMAEWVGSKLR